MRVCKGDKEHPHSEIVHDEPHCPLCVCLVHLKEFEDIVQDVRSVKDGRISLGELSDRAESALIPF